MSLAYTSTSVSRLKPLRSDKMPFGRLILILAVLLLFCGCSNFQGAKALEFFSHLDESGRWKNSERADFEGRMLSEKGRETLDRLLYQNEALVSRLKEEFAAMSHHDNCKGGLLAHTVKMVDFLPIVLDNYPVLFSDKDISGELKASPDKRDLLVIGCILHDIGKTREMDYGVYQKGSFVSHRFFGAEMVEEHKDYIVGQYGEEWFYHLIAILLQHHDQFGDPCRDVYALIVHKIDDIESSLTNLSQEIEQNGNTDPSGQFIWYDNKTLYY